MNASTAAQRKSHATSAPAGDDAYDVDRLLGRRFTGLILRSLRSPARFTDLLRLLPDSTNRILTERLRDLAAAGLVERVVDAGPPTRITYRLTDDGHALLPALDLIAEVSARRRSA